MTQQAQALSPDFPTTENQENSGPFTPATQRNVRTLLLIGRLPRTGSSRMHIRDRGEGHGRGGCGWPFSSYTPWREKGLEYVISQMIDSNVARKKRPTVGVTSFILFHTHIRVNHVTDDVLE